MITHNEVCYMITGCNKNSNFAKCGLSACKKREIGSTKYIAKICKTETATVTPGDWFL